MSYDVVTWSDIAYMERNEGCLPDRGSSAGEIREYFGDPDGGDYDPDHVREVMRDVGDKALIARVAELERRLGEVIAAYEEVTGEDYYH